MVAALGVVFGLALLACGVAAGIYGRYRKSREIHQRFTSRDASEGACAGFMVAFALLIAAALALAALPVAVPGGVVAAGGVAALAAEALVAEKIGAWSETADGLNSFYRETTRPVTGVIEHRDVPGSSDRWYWLADPATGAKIADLGKLDRYSYTLSGFLPLDGKVVTMLVHDDPASGTTFHEFLARTRVPVELHDGSVLPPGTVVRAQYGAPWVNANAKDTKWVVSLSDSNPDDDAVVDATTALDFSDPASPPPAPSAPSPAPRTAGVAGALSRIR